METKLCRLCAKSTQNFTHIFKVEGLREKIETCLPIIVSPYCLLPDTICGECLESINNFYTFMKDCLQKIIILETQFDIQESCLKSRRRKEKSCYVDFSYKASNVGVQTEDFLDVLVGKDADLKKYSLNFPLITKFLDTSAFLKPKSAISLVDYDADSNSSEDGTETGKVILGERLEAFEKITNFVDSFLSQKHHFASKKSLDDGRNDLISEISQRKSLKRKADRIENTQTKIFKRDTFSRRKSNQPKKLESQLTRIGEESSFYFENFPTACQTENESSSLNSSEKIEFLSNETDNQQNAAVQNEKILSSLPQSCLLCDTHFVGSAALAAHVFEMHGIDLAEVISSGSGESFPEKNKKKIPNLVKISDLKREENHAIEQDAEDPPTLFPSFVCPSCPAVFTAKPDLMMHLRVKHAQQAAHLCGLCLQQCNTYPNLQAHLEVCSLQHPVATKYVCQVCRYGNDNFKWLENHVLVHDFLLDVCKKEARMFDPANYVGVNDKFENGALSPGANGLHCGECGLGDFESFKEFSSHRRNQHSIFHCDLCNKFYGRNSHLWKHVNRLHKGHPSITCQLCYKTSASKYHLAQHFNKIHLAKGARKSDAQSERDDFMTQKFQGFDFQSVKQCFMRQEMMEQARKDSVSEAEEIMNHSSDQDDELILDYNIKEEPLGKEDVAAPKEIDSSHNLYTNIITNYTPPLNKGEYKCPKCSKAFHKKVLLKKHKKNCRPKLQKDLLTRCKTCARIFKDRQSLAKHLVNYHSEYACEICDEKVQSKCEIVAHIRFQHPGCHLFCKACGNILRSKQDLQAHLRDHLDSYVCQFCADSLPSKIKLKMHILSLHRKILSLSCGICLKLFETQHILKDHVTLVHKDQLTPLTSCPVCGKNYGSKWKTYDHLNKSHGRIFRACKTCLEVFDNDAQLQAHYDVTAHGAQTAAGVNSAAVRNNVMAHVATAINEVVTQNDANNEEEESNSGDDENDDNSEQSNDEYENEMELQKEDSKDSKPQVHESKISLLEKRLLGKRISEDEQTLTRPPTQGNNNRSSSNSVEIIRLPGESKREARQAETLAAVTVKKEDDCEATNSLANPQVNSSKRTVYVNSNDPSYCEICFKTWPAKKHLWQHYIRCHKSVAATVCGICLKTNDDYESLQVHLRETHPTLLHGQGFGSNFICRICGRYHNARSKLRLHMVIHENFDWSLISAPPKPQAQDDAKELDMNGITEIKEEQSNDNIEMYDENDINYESLIEQVECSSQSENEDSDNEQSSHVEVKDEQASSSDDDDDEEESEESAMSENSMQAQMLKNMLSEKQKLNPDAGQEYASSSDDSSSSFSDDNNDGTKSESSEDECSRGSRSMSSQQNTRSNSNTVDSVLNGNMFKHKTDELDSAIKSISYECMVPEDVKVEEDYCDVHNNCLNEKEIESAVGSIL